MTTPRSSQTPTLIELGQVVGHFGVKGELKVFLHNRDSDTLYEPHLVVLRSPEGRELRGRLECRAGAGGRVLGRMEGIASPEEAATYKGWTILVEPEALPRKAPGEYYHRDLLGHPVRTESGQELGVITEIWPGEVDVWVARQGGRDRWIPARKELVISIGEAIIVSDALADQQPSEPDPEEGRD